jgi:hypothetical protein
VTVNPRLLLPGLSGALALLALGGCAGQGSAEDGNAARAAVEFSRAVRSSTGAAGGLLAPQTLKELEDSQGPCPSALPAELEPASGPAESTQVYGKDAMVRLSTDTIFLARFAQGWRVTAAGCTRSQAGRPYDCKVKGS